MYRPTYTDEQFKLALDYSARHGTGTLDLALDCACGSGQAGIGFAPHFETVMGVDVSPAQVEAAQMSPPAKNMIFRVGDSSNLPVDSSSIDLLCVGEALHWFDIPKFYAEAARVLRPRGTVVILGYAGSFVADHPGARAAFDSVWAGLLEPYWHPRKVIIESLYRGHEPPTALFDVVERHDEGMRMERQWGVEEMVGYCESWSAYSAYLQQNSVTKGSAGDPAVILRAALVAALGDRKSVTMVWPVCVLLGTRRSS